MLRRAKRAIHTVINRLAGLNYYTAKAYYMYLLEYNGKKYSGPPLLIYQMGKVGSTSIQKSLEEMNLDMPIYHTHGLSLKYIGEKEQVYKEHFGTEMVRHMDAKAAWDSQYLRNWVLKNSDGKKSKIVTLVRDPVIRKISSFFQRVAEVEYSDGGKGYKIISHFDNYEFSGTMDNMEGLTKLFLDVCKKEVHNDRALHWFDLEFRDVLGLDVFASEFPKSKGYRIYREKLADVLLFRLENLNECCEPAFKEFLDLDGFSLSNKNVGKEKSYAPLYQAFKRSVALPQSFLDEMYSTRYVKHFYSEEEIQTFKTRWQNSTQNGNNHNT